MKRLSLFNAYGVEMEYMIVDRNTLAVLPITDKLIYSVTQQYVSDVERGKIAWSNELVNHVIELKTNGPSPDIESLSVLFQENVEEINRLLMPFNAMLLPTASHPFMDPFKETVIWPHENNEIYSLYNRVFDCRGHGWSNVQSTHLNLPFANDEEFGILHAAIRILLPVIPALSASSPVLDGKATGMLDTRLEYYRLNQQRIPSICGGVIPERAFTESDYNKIIFEPIQRDIRPFDTEGILEKYFLNSRGAIARFDRGAIEIRIIDIQECPAADLAILEIVIAMLKRLISTENLHLQEWHEDRLRAIFLETLRKGEHAIIDDAEYLALFDLSAPATAGDIWKKAAGMMPLTYRKELEIILSEGTLATRILKRLGQEFTHERLISVYRELAQCLQENRQFR
jgi:carboxylate-amine ligase